MVTDGRLVDPFLARQAADRLKKNGIRLAIALEGQDHRHSALIEYLASTPKKDNIIQIPALEDLSAYLKFASKLIVTSTCSKVVSYEG